MTMAEDRVNQLNGDHPLVEQFWDAYEYLNSSRSAAFTLNHYEADAQQVAINLNEIYKVAARNYQVLPDIKEMKNLLRSSRRYKFIDMNKAVRTNKYPADEVKNVSAEDETPFDRSHTVKCWIFSNPSYGAQK